MKISAEGLALIKKFEGCELTAYQCSAGVWTIGYGHTKSVTEGMEITNDIANDMLEAEVCEYESYINHNVSVPLKQNQFDEVGVNPFNAPVPGESLTASPDTPKSWERPPEFTDQ